MAKRECYSCKRPKIDRVEIAEGRTICFDCVHMNAMDRYEDWERTPKPLRRKAWGKLYGKVGKSPPRYRMRPGSTLKLQGLRP